MTVKAARKRNVLAARRFPAISQPLGAFRGRGGVLDPGERHGAFLRLSQGVGLAYNPRDAMMVRGLQLAAGKTPTDKQIDQLAYERFELSEDDIRTVEETIT